MCCSSDGLDEKDYLDPFQLGFSQVIGQKCYWLCLWMISGENEMWLEYSSVLLDLLVAFDNVNHGIILVWLQGMGLGGTIFH